MRKAVVAVVMFGIVSVLASSSEASSQGGGEPTHLSCRGVGAACDDAKDSDHWCCTTPRTLQCVNHRCR